MSTSTTDSSSTTTSPFPLNRIVAFGGPYIAVLSGAVADWLIVHVHLLTAFHTTKTQVASAITQLGVFGLTALLVWAGHQKWLTGWQKWENSLLPEVEKVLEKVPAGSAATTFKPPPSGGGLVTGAPKRRPSTYKTPAQDE